MLSKTQVCYVSLLPLLIPILVSLNGVATSKNDRLGVFSSLHNPYLFLLRIVNAQSISSTLPTSSLSRASCYSSERRVRGRCSLCKGFRRSLVQGVGLGHGALGDRAGSLYLPPPPGATPSGLASSHGQELRARSTDRYFFVYGISLHTTNTNSFPETAKNLYLLNFCRVHNCFGIKKDEFTYRCPNRSR